MTLDTSGFLRKREAAIYETNAARQPDGFACVALRPAEYREMGRLQPHKLAFFDRRI